MPRRPDPDAALPPLERYISTLENLYAARRAEDGRGVATAGTALEALREDLTPTQRLRVDRRENELNVSFRAWLGMKPEKAPPAGRDDTTAPRKRPLPSASLPGSEAKIRDLTARRGLQQALHDTDDVVDDPDRGLKPPKARNGARRLRGRGVVVASQRRGVGTIVPSLADRIRQLRERSGLTRKALAGRTKLSLRCIALLETGRRRHPRSDTLALLATALRTSVDALLGVRDSGPAG